MVQVQNYSYRKTRTGEVATLKPTQLWLNLNQVLTIDSTTKSESSPWWRIQCTNDSEFYTSRAVLIELGILPEPAPPTPLTLNEIEKELAVLKGRVDTLEAKVDSYPYAISRYSWNQTPWSGVQARLLSPNFIVYSQKLVSIEQVEGGYWKVALTSGDLYYTDSAGAETLGVVLD